MTQDIFCNYSNYTNIGFKRRVRITTNYTWGEFFANTDQRLPIAETVLVYDIE